MTTTADAQVFTWDTMDTDHPMDLLDRRRIIGEQVMISHVTLHKGFTVAAHHHENEQMAIVTSGRVRFTVGQPGAEREETLGPGQVLYLPANVPHSAEALETSVVLDVFSPPSEKTGVDG